MRSIVNVVALKTLDVAGMVAHSFWFICQSDYNVFVKPLDLSLEVLKKIVFIDNNPLENLKIVTRR